MSAPVKLMPRRDETPRSEQVHGIRDGRAYCGRKVSKRSAVWTAVTCPDCWAMRRADDEAGGDAA